jgi:hypothetical protein
VDVDEYLTSLDTTVLGEYILLATMAQCGDGGSYAYGKNENPDEVCRRREEMDRKLEEQMKLLQEQMEEQRRKIEAEKENDSSE